jgi:TonB family protein
LKYGLFVPLFAIALVASSATIRNNKNIKEIANDLPLEKPLAAVTEVVQKAIVAPLSQNPVAEAKRKAEVPADLSGSKTYEDWKPFYNYLMRSIRYPSVAFNAKLQGKSTVKFSITNGEVEGIGVASNPLGSKTDAEVMRAILAYGDFNAAEDGKYLITVSFTLEDATTPIVNASPVKLSGYSALGEVVIRGYPKKEPINKTASLLNEVNVKADDSGKIYDFVSLDAAPTFPGGMNEFYAYVQKSIKYPQEAKDNKIQGKVFLSFVVETDGTLSDIKVERKLGGGTDEEAVRVIEESPKWIPGVQNGQRVRVKYNIPISFSLTPGTDAFGMAKGLSINKAGNGYIIIGNPKSETPPLYIIDGVKVKPSETSPLSSVKQEDIASIEVLKDETATKLYGDGGKYGVILITTKQGKTDKPLEQKPANNIYGFVGVDTQPSFPGGMDKFYQYIGKAVRYPVEAQKNNIQGKVFLSFIVEKDGTLTDIKVERKVDPSLDAEAIRLVKGSAKWLPGKQDGKPVRVKYNLPIAFTLSK